MKIELKKTGTKFNEIDISNFFEYNNNIYIKTNEDLDIENAINLSENNEFVFGIFNNEIIIPKKFKLVEI